MLCSPQQMIGNCFPASNNGHGKQTQLGVGWGGGLRLSASLQTLLFFSSSYFMIFIFPVFTVVTRLCRLPSPPPRGRITHIGISFHKDCLVGTKDSTALTPGVLDFTILFNLLKLKRGSPCTS